MAIWVSFVDGEARDIPRVLHLFWASDIEVVPDDKQLNPTEGIHA